MTTDAGRLDDPDPPVASVVGMDVDEVAARYRAQGFHVQIVPVRADGSAPMTADLSVNRIRLLTSDGETVRLATRG